MRAASDGRRGKFGARVGERADVEMVHPGQNLDVLVHHRSAFVVTRAAEIGAPLHPVHDDGGRVAQVAVYLRYRDPHRTQQLLHAAFVLQREDGPHVGPGAADVQLQQLTVPAKVDEPRRAPTGLATNRHHLTTQVRLQLVDQIVCSRVHRRRAGDLSRPTTTQEPLGSKAGMTSRANSAIRRLISGTGAGMASRPKMTQRLA